jgi:hypothetical protein
MEFQLSTAKRNLPHSVNHTFGRFSYRLVSVRQKFCQNREILHRILRTFGIGLNIDNVGWRMPGKILLESAPRAGQDPAASIETGNRSSENITRQREGCDVATGRTSVGVQINFRRLPPDENPIGGVGINLAVQDAIAAANLLGDRLAAGEHLDDHALDAVRRRRLLPTRMIQQFQVLAQNRVLKPALSDHGVSHIDATPIRIIAHAPLLQRLAARMLGLGVRLERVRKQEAPPRDVA